MNKMPITATLVPAVSSDFFTEAGELKESGVVFSRSRTGGYVGPRFIELISVEEIEALMNSLFFFKLKNDRKDYSFEFEFILDVRQAGPDDFRWSPKHPRYFRPYYKRENNMISGPHILLESTDMKSLAKDILSGKIYVPDEKQNFVQIIKTIAS